MWFGSLGACVDVKMISFTVSYILRIFFKYNVYGFKFVSTSAPPRRCGSDLAARAAALEKAVKAAAAAAKAEPEASALQLCAKEYSAAKLVSGSQGLSPN